MSLTVFSLVFLVFLAANLFWGYGAVSVFYLGVAFCVRVQVWKLFILHLSLWYMYAVASLFDLK